MVDKLQRGGTRVEIRWVPAHTGIWGNELADKAAMAATNQYLSGNPESANVEQSKTYQLRTTLKT